MSSDIETVRVMPDLAHFDVVEIFAGQSRRVTLYRSKSRLSWYVTTSDNSDFARFYEHEQQARGAFRMMCAGKNK